MILRKLKIGLLLGLTVSLLVVGVTQAQTPRPTPTNVATPVAEEDDERGGTIQGVVYQDVNGDGRCVDTGVAGEGPVEGIPVEFVSSDEQTVITLYSGPDGIYGLFAAGYSNWAVSAKPDAEWVVTSEKTQYAAIYADSLVATGVNFCVQKALQAQVVLPASGRPGASLLWLAALLGLGFVAVGTGLHLHRRRS